MIVLRLIWGDWWKAHGEGAVIAGPAVSRSSAGGEARGDNGTAEIDVIALMGDGVAAVFPCLELWVDRSC
jgi:hypothetical protein